MFSEILKIIPKLDGKEMDKLEKNLSGRFGRVAKKFGKGLTNIFKGGGWVGLAVGLLDKILNPLKGIQESMEKTLAYSNDVVNNAEQFGTTAGRLSRLGALAQAKGIDQGALYGLINKFQVAVANAEADPNTPSVVRNYVGQKDMAAGFFQFIQNLKGMEKSQRLLAETNVFGEKQVLKVSDFINTDFSELLKTMEKAGLRSNEFYENRFQKGNRLSGLEDTLGAVRAINENAGKAGAMNEGMIRSRDRSEQERIKRETQQLTAYQDLAKVSDTVAKIEGAIQQGLGLIGKVITVLEGPVTRLVEVFEKFTQSSWVQKAKNYFSGSAGGK